VKLLFDENWSYRLVDMLQDEFEGSTHARSLGLSGAPDTNIWNYARDNGFAIVSKDDDFRQRSFVNGAPPKIIWLRVGNLGTQAIAELLMREAARVRTFEDEEESTLLILGSTV